MTCHYFYTNTDNITEAKFLIKFYIGNHREERNATCLTEKEKRKKQSQSQI